MRLDIDTFDHILDVRGRWGFLQEENKNVTFGMNEKGGMDEKEFEEYIMNSILPLFPMHGIGRRGTLSSRWTVVWAGPTLTSW
jgi:hypothetical protein